MGRNIFHFSFYVVGIVMKSMKTFTLREKWHKLLKLPKKYFQKLLNQGLMATYTINQFRNHCRPCSLEAREIQPIQAISEFSCASVSKRV